MTIRSTLAVAALTALAVGPIPAALTPVTLDAAQAETSKSSGHGHGNADSRGHSNTAAGHGNSAATAKAENDAPAVVGTTGKGNLASELKGLNAVRANPNALEHASPDSQVGRIAAYRNAAQGAISAQSALNAAKATLASLNVPSRGIEAIDIDIAALDPNSVDYADALAVLQAERSNAMAYADATTAVDLATNEVAVSVEEEHATLLTASGGRELSAVAIAEIRRVLGL